MRLLGYPDPLGRSRCEEKDHAVPQLRCPDDHGDAPPDDALATACSTAARAGGPATSGRTRPTTICPVPTDVAVLVVLWRLQYKLSLRNVAEMFLTRGFTFTHETAPAREERFAPLLTARLKARRRGKAGCKGHVDETYVKVAGRWHYLYRAIDSEGNLVETMLSTTRDMDAAKRFFACALKTVGEAPEKVTTDGHDSYPRAVRETLGPDVCHRTSRSMNNRIEQDHPRHQAALPSHAGVRFF